ncbi:MAG TPA: DUF2264 domain-containing protein [Prolixibacteraceae bacterium]|nr:DUF2264 domain-containing protein [Prolixibacteraceae bacterium]
MNRRNVFKYLSLLGLAPLANNLSAASVINTPEIPDRKYWLNVMIRIATPLLESLSKGELRKNMPVECKPGRELDRRKVTYLEAFGRLMAGMAPWLELGVNETDEGQVRKEFILLAQKSMKMAVDPQSPYFMNFTEGGQPLVDAAFLAHAILRAPNVLWAQLDNETKQQLVIAMKSTHTITPGYSNWLLFSAMVEAFLLFAGEQHDELRMDLTIRKHMEWYKGDGMYGDGPDFHWDYYNSYVIQPMLADVLQELMKHGNKYEKTFETVLLRARRYAEIQERLISPEGTFPAIGRSLPYRFGAFQLLAQMALQHQLPDDLNPAQVRSALSAVIQRMIEAPGTFDSKGWLTIGFYGHQPNIAEPYISTGSLYLCSVGLLPLGLPADDPFWADAPQDWTAKKIWSGQDFPADHAINE